jgi:curli biogenesis system outer membrane secretion channel CsgG
MKRIPLIIALLTTIILLSQCGTSTRVKVLKPAELDVGAVKKVAVLDFDFKGSWDFADEKKKDKEIKELARILLKDMFKGKKPPNPKKAYPGSTVSDRLVAKLVNNQYYTVIERKELSKILQEQALSLSGVIDANQAAEVGKLLGAEGLIMGSGTYNVQDRGQWETYKEKKVEKKRYRIFRQVDVKFTYKIVNITTGTIVASKTNSASTGRNKSAKYSSTGKNEKEAMNNIPAWRPIVDDMVDKVLNQTLWQVAPHYVTESREIEEGDSEQMEIAVEYAKRNLWEDAREVWDMVAADQSAEKEDRVGATYNLGLYYELTGDLDVAERLFDKAFKMSGDSKYLDSRARIERRRKELERLKQQQS